MRNEEKIKSHYYPRLEKYSNTYEILDWESAAAQNARFEVLIRHINLDGKSILDAGCGCGDLFTMLKEKGINVTYTGVDILPAMIEKAQSLHGGGQFICGDLFGEEPVCTNKFDVVFTSGIFNLNLGNNASFFDTALPVLDRLAEDALVINLLDEGSPDRDDNYFYFNPDEAKEKMESIGRKVTLIKDYLSNDFTLIGKKHIIK
ncbi:MAG: methyltransferase domain-containing protein [Spirochaetia bacterium]|jgi:SAM-dependent methyltransferase|nr:methyltransferase domain-containing protein [Spirochaetia bacterium]